MVRRGPGYRSGMQTPQQPEPGRSGRPAPEDNRPGHHPEHEQDQPDLDEFAEALGIEPESDDPGGHA
jgi:hypothetical protein